MTAFCARFHRYTLRYHELMKETGRELRATEASEQSQFELTILMTSPSESSWLSLIRRPARASTAWM